MLNFCRVNPAMERIVTDQKKHSVASNTPISYYSNITSMPDFMKYLQQQIKRCSPDASEMLDRPEEWGKWCDYWEKVLITGEQFITLPEDSYFDSLHSVLITLETLDCADQRAGIRWRKSMFHNHDFFELLYVYRGHCSTTISGVDVELSAGDICMYNLQAVHRIGISGEEDAVFNVLIKKELFQQTFFQLQSGNSLVTDFFLHSLYHIQAPGQHLVFHPREDGRCEAILQMMIEEAYQNRPLGQEFLKTMLSALFTELFHQYYETIRALNRQEPGAVDLAQVIGYMAAHATSVTLEQTARHFGYTPRSMIRFFKKYANSTFRRILQDLRLKQAAVLLKDSSKSIQEIAVEIGYSNRGYFHNLFQEHYGLTPAEYRQKFRKSP